MSFEQWITVVALATGPLGIWLGWFLAQRSEANRAKITSREQRDRDQAARVVAIVDAAQQNVGDVESLINAEAMRRDGQTVDPLQYGEVVRDLNATRARLGLLAAETAIFGPAWAMDDVNKIHAGQREAGRLLDVLLQRAAADDTDVAGAVTQLRAVEVDIDRLVAEASRRYVVEAP